MRKTRVEALGLESPDLAPAPARYELWKVARTKSDGRMTSSSTALIPQKIDELVKQQTQGTFVGQGRDDILTTAIRKPEHAGRVRGVPGAIGLRDYFGPAQKNTQSMTPTPPRVSTRGSCSAIDPTEYSGQYKLLVDGDPSRIVAVRRKQPMHELVIDEDDDLAEAEDDPLAKLMTKLPRLNRGPVELYWDNKVFGIPHVPIYITFNNALEIIGEDRMLNISILQLWYMDTIIVEQGRSSMNGFVEPQTIQPSGNTIESKQKYLETWIAESNKDIYFVPYIDGSHWQLMLIIPKQCKICNKQLDSWECGYYVMSWIKTIIRVVITDDWNECNKKNDSWACGYYIMSWMKAIIRAEIIGDWIEVQIYI
ncbi:hypothetical protein LR48_Vigan304s002800 [Vigna angularis]|uniref:Ubiquitin-like protease family profile domain-containing protein n=1 Tax=Phaseolus angularis TaxID=3914 RepID=A0A0L9T8J4_PHAAN|nr:hypothetical protein LR48_Vigan304s002800 [Vigna angularis]